MPTTPRSESRAEVGVAAALPISPDATASRVLVNNDLLRVVTFAMDAGQELTDHSSPRAVIVQMLAGTLTFTVGSTRYDLVAGDVIYLAPGERHAVVATSACRFALVLVDAPA